MTTPRIESTLKKRADRDACGWKENEPGTETWLNVKDNLPEEE